jgi:hypothetical protein
MYHLEVIQRNLEREIDRSRRLLNDQKFEYVRHSPADCQQGRDFFNSLIDDDGRLKRDLKYDELKWITNERALCRWDFEYWRTRYYFIETIDERLALFEPNIAQHIQSDIMAELEIAGKSIQIMNPKARQVGITTDWESRVAHRVQFRSNVNAVVASSDPGKSALMAEKMQTAWDHMPWYLMPKKGPPWNAKQKEFPEQNSAVTIQSGAQFHGVARGHTPTVAHLSEVSEFNDPAADIDAAMLRAMHPTPKLLVGLESTCLMMNDWWHNMWKAVKAKISRFVGRFYGWFLAHNLYPTDTFMVEHPIPGNWIPMERVVRHAEKCRRYVQSDPYMTKYLGSGWQMPIEQIWYYEFELKQAMRKHAVNSFLREMPADDEEMWQVTGLSVFDAEVLQAHWDGCKAPLGVYQFQARGDVIRPELQVNLTKVDPTKPPIEIEAEWTEGHRIEAKLVPIKFEGYGTAEDDEGRDRLFIWEYPRVGCEYGLGIDTSEGIGADQAVLEGIRKQTNFELAEQVCEYASKWANPIDMINLSLIVGSLYSPPSRTGEPRQAKIVAEIKSESDIVQFMLRKHGWHNFHQFLNIDRQGSHMLSERLGWYTTPWSRRRILAWLIYNIKNFGIIVNSPWFINELKTLHRDMYEQALRAETGAHDDRVMCKAFTWYSLHEAADQSPEGVLLNQVTEESENQTNLTERQMYDLQQCEDVWGIDVAQLAGRRANFDPVYSEF